MTDLRSALRAVVPHGLVEWRRKRFLDQSIVTERAGFHEQRKRHARDFNATGASERLRIEFDWDDAVAHLASFGLPVDQIVAGSIPHRSLEFCRDIFAKHFSNTKPLVGLHVGAFVGISLCALASISRQINRMSVVVSVDPNIPHRGIENPHEWVVSLAQRYNLLGAILPVAAFSDAINLPNDGADLLGDGRDVRPIPAFEGALQSLSMLAPNPFSWALLDGNHDGDYVRVEIDHMQQHLQAGGVLLLDDNPYWQELRDLFRTLDPKKWRNLGSDGRVAALLRLPQ